MASGKVSISNDSIQAQLKRTVDAVLIDARRMQVVAEAVELTMRELFGDAEAEEIRNTAVILRAQTLGLLLEILRLAGKAERLEAIADVRDAAQSSEIAN